MILAIRKILVLSLLFSCNGTLLAQASLNGLLNDLQSINPSLKALNKEYQAALEWEGQVSQLPDPVFQTGYFLSRPETRVGPQILQFGVSQNLPWKGTIAARKNLMNSKAEVKKESVEIADLNFQHLIKNAWLDLYKIQEQQNIIQEYIQIYSVLEQLVLTKIENGSAQLDDALNIQVALLELNQQLQILELEKRTPQIGINRILNRDLNTSININEKLKLFSWSTVFENGLENIESSHPLFQQYIKEKQVALNEIQLNALENKPAFTVGLNYVILSPIEDALIVGNGRNILMPSVKLNLPIQRQKYQSRNQEMEINLARIEDKKAEAINDFLSHIENAKVLIETAELKNELYITQLRTLDAAVEIRQTRFSTDSEGLDALLQLHEEMITYELKILDSILDTHRAKFEIERILTD